MKSKDLIRLFGVEGLVDPRSILNMTDEEIGDKVPFEITCEIKEIIDILNDSIRSGKGDVDIIFKCLAAIQRRVSNLQEVAIGIKKMLGD